jgi:tetratricopeptide (TPR) repeat protein
MAKSDKGERRIRRAALALLLLALTGAGEAAAQSAESDSLRELRREAREASMRGDNSRTISYYTAALRLAKQEGQVNSQAYCLNGLAEVSLRQQRSFAQAGKLLGQARTLPAGKIAPPVRARTLELSGHLEIALNRPERGAACALEGIQLLEGAGAGDSIEIPNLYTLHGVACQALGRYDDAITSFEASLRTRPARDTASPSALITKSCLALAYATKGEDDAALGIITARVLCGVAVESAPANVQEIVCSTLAHIEASKGLREEALRHQLQALELATKLYSPNNPAIADFYRSVADRYAETGDYGQSLAYANRGVHLLEAAPAAQRRALAACSDAKATALLGLSRLPDALACTER